MQLAKMYEQFLSKTVMGFCLVDQNGTILKTNKAFQKITNNDELIGTNLNNILSNKNLDQFLPKVIINKESSLEVNFSSYNNYFAIANASLLLKNDKETIIAIIFTEVSNLITSLENRIAMEVKKNSKKDKILSEQSKLATMGEMIGNIAHQWRQPLNILALVFQDLYIKFKLNELTEDQMEKNYGKVNNVLQYMSQTIDDFRTFFQSEDGPVTFKINLVINSVLDLMESRCQANNIKCNFTSKEDILVVGTKNGFQQVIINLLNNAYDAITSQKNHKKGFIHINTKRYGTVAVISISDNGGGIAKDILDQIFEPYFTTKHKTQGTGLGLYMSKQIIEYHMAGKLEIKNSQLGAIFTITLPTAKNSN